VYYKKALIYQIIGFELIKMVIVLEGGAKALLGRRRVRRYELNHS
jgi:hypothetical protein